MHGLVWSGIAWYVARLLCTSGEANEVVGGVVFKNER